MDSSSSQQPTRGRHPNHLSGHAAIVVHGGLGYMSGWTDVSSISGSIANASYGNNVFDFSHLTASENDALITPGPSVTGSIVDLPLNDYVSSWVDRSQAAVAYDPFNMALFNDEFSICDPSMAVVNGPNYLHTAIGFGRMCMQPANRKHTPQWRIRRP
ncbi:hypothetical protein OIDMADRAFT_36086 [Oidiodendron maius Zn]|uniref:Uncharacterized protein n=1 Tax=Oidiodendron maius (strain Zn) TaxID=913774 RepID=A0A0C3GNC8_OIDMZ|nr:hypothetical protein OIDMADRAFT_36086 [Oidiodendron maius Zn]